MQLMSQTLDVVNRKMSTVMPLRGRLFSKDQQADESLSKATSYDENDESSETVPEFEVDDEFDLPISVALTLLLLYMMAGAAVFTIWEKWTFFESFYFVYISLSTIGFGDYVPEHPAFMMCTFIYLLFGLALTSMCINVVQEKLSSTFQKAKLRIGATMGLDMTQLVEEELNQDNANPLSNNNNNNAPSNGTPKILKEEGVGDALREKREKKRKMSSTNNVNKESVGEKDSAAPSAKETAATSEPKPAKARPKSVEFEQA